MGGRKVTQDAVIPYTVVQIIQLETINHAILWAGFGVSLAVLFAGFMIWWAIREDVHR